MITKQVQYSIHTVIPRGGIVEKGVKKGVRLLVPAKVEEAFSYNPAELDDLVKTAVEALQKGYSKFKNLKAKTFILNDSGTTGDVMLEKVYTSKNRMAGTHYTDASEAKDAGRRLTAQLNEHDIRYNHKKPFKPLTISNVKPDETAEVNEIAAALQTSPAFDRKFVMDGSKDKSIKGWAGNLELEFDNIGGTKYPSLVASHRSSTPFALARIKEGVTHEATDKFAKSIELAQFNEVVPFN